MVSTYPYTYYACPCTTPTPTLSAAKKHARTPSSTNTTDEELPEEATPLNPHDARSNYSLYPLNSLLYCDECQKIACQRCCTEEILNWYCPNCLFEVPSSSVKADGNRCSRNCYNCPLCTAPLAVTTLEPQQQSREHPTPGDNIGSSTSQERIILSCQYCDWTSLDIGVQLSRSTKITEQLTKLRKKQGTRSPTLGDSQSEGPEDDGEQSLDQEDAFANLSTFYKDQLNSGDPSNPFPNSPYSSPANLARIMNIYGGLSQTALKKSREKPQPMREAYGRDEGFRTYTADSRDEDAIIEKLRTLGWEETITTEQRSSMPPNHDARFTDQLWPVATPLRTRRGKRCRTCRQFIVRGEAKISSARYKIRLLAQQHIPHLTLRPLHQPTLPPPNLSFRLRPTDPTTAPKPLQPHTPNHHILTLTNPLFEPVKVTLASPSTTPGRVQSRITILCPSFTIGPAGDVWDDALSTSTNTPTPATSTETGRKAALSSLTGSSNSENERQPEAGKIWDKTRNSTSVVLEVVPGALQAAPRIVPKSKEEKLREKEEEEEEIIRDGDEILEVPVFVRVEWMAEVSATAGLGVGLGEGEGKKRTGEKEAREVAFWCVLGVGEIAGRDC